MSNKLFKYYVYVSSSKVEMLYSQIPRRFLNGVAGELKVNLGIASSTLTQKASEETVYSKLSAVLRYIHENVAVGSIDSPEDYFSGNGIVRWGLYDNQGSLVLFVGSTDATIFALGGSSAHVLGNKTQADTPPVSTTPFLVDILCDELQLDALNEVERENIAFLVNQGHSRTDLALLAVAHAHMYMTAPSQKVEFLAKRLLHKEQKLSSDKGVLLGTPLYVALAE